jgi:hypothetical protein
MIEVEPGGLNLQTLAGEAAVIIQGSDLPNLLYVFGFGDADHDYYVDPLIPGVERLVEFLIEREYDAAVGMPYHPKQRPAIGICKDVRADRIEEATELCVLALMFINNRITIP